MDPHLIKPLLYIFKFSSHPNPNSRYLFLTHFLLHWKRNKKAKKKKLYSVSLSPGSDFSTQTQLVSKRVRDNFGFVVRLYVGECMHTAFNHGQ